ncbi:MAG: succinate dehydrogenase, hydrophobic membrane anchor protein [Asticcacaulis sp.]
MTTDRNVGARSVTQWKLSAHHGAGEWLAERGTALVMLPLILWGLWSATGIMGGGYEAALGFVQVPLNAGLIGLLVALACWHMFMGLKMIIDDYIDTKGTRNLLVFVVFLLSAAVVIATGLALFSVIKGA